MYNCKNFKEYSDYFLISKNSVQIDKCWQCGKKNVKLHKHSIYISKKVFKYGDELITKQILYVQCPYCNSIKSIQPSCEIGENRIGKKKREKS